MADETKRKILLVDDDSEILESMRLSLEKLDQDILTASDGNQAVEVAVAEDPEIVVLDLMLPKRGGFLVLQKLKGSPQAKGKKPFVIMIKPFRMERLVELVETYLAKS